MNIIILCFYNVTLDITMSMFVSSFLADFVFEFTKYTDCYILVWYGACNGVDWRTSVYLVV